MEFGLSGAILLASNSLAGSADQLASCELVAARPAVNRSATRFELSQHVETARTCLRQDRNHVCDQLAHLLASWIVPDR